VRFRFGCGLYLRIYGTFFIFTVIAQCLHLCHTPDIQILGVSDSEEDLMFCWPCIIVYQYSETNVMHFLFNLLRIKGLYMFQALLTHPQGALHKRHLVYCVRVMSVGCTRIGVRKTGICFTPHGLFQSDPVQRLIYEFKTLRSKAPSIIIYVVNLLMNYSVPSAIASSVLYCSLLQGPIKLTFPHLLH
jgi:hypothetical protein